MTRSDGNFRCKKGRLVIGVLGATFITAHDSDHDGAAEAAGMSVRPSRR
jgi:hypothetical protein